MAGPRSTPSSDPGGYTEPPIVTADTDFTAARHLLPQCPDGQSYPAADAITYLLGA